MHLAGPKKPVPVVGVPSASMIGAMRGHSAGYNLFHIEGGCDSCRIHARCRGVVPGTRNIADLGTITLN